MQIDNQQESSENLSSDECGPTDGIGSGPNVLKSPIAYEQPKDERINLSTEILKCFEKYSDKTLIVGGGREGIWTGKRLLDVVGKVSTELYRHLDLGPGKTVLLLCDHHDREVVMALACFVSGCAIFPQNPVDGFEEIKTTCSMVPSIDLIVTQCMYHHLAVELVKALQKGPKKIRIFWTDVGTINNQIPWDVLLLDEVINKGFWDEDYLECIGANAINARECPAYYMLTSGSTGYPKVVDNSQWGLLSNARSMFHSTQTAYNPDLPEERLLPLDENSILAGDLPMDHGAGIGFILLSLFLGARQIIIPVDDVERLCKAIGQHKINFLINGSTKVFRFLKKVKEDALAKSATAANQLDYDLSSLRHISNVGAKVNFLQLIRDIEELLPNLSVTQSYGCTEVGHVATLPFSESRGDMQSVGWLYPGVLGIVVDSEGNQLGPNERGELHLWADSLFTKYICREKMDAQQALADSRDSKGYYKTGDLVHYDERGRLYIHGRIKETLFLHSEWKILPAELEAVVNEHPLIEFSAIVGVPDSEVPGVDAAKAFVKLIDCKSAKYLQLKENEEKLDDDGANFSKLLKAFDEKDLEFIRKDIYDFAAARTAPEKHLNGGVRILEDFPNNGRLQKIDRKALKLMA